MVQTAHGIGNVRKREGAVDTRLELTMLHELDEPFEVVRSEWPGDDRTEPLRDER